VSIVDVIRDDTANEANLESKFIVYLEHLFSFLANSVTVTQDEGQFVFKVMV